MNPNTVAQNRTARLVAEARTPVYSTVTTPVVREHRMVVELEWPEGGRWWSKPMFERDVETYIATSSAEISDIDHAASCWCVKEGRY